MSLVGNDWGDSVADDILAASSGLNSSEESQIRTAWRLVASAHVDYVTANAEVDVSSDGSTGTGPLGGPLPIAALPGSGDIS